jgi:alanine racemase
MTGHPETQAADAGPQAQLTVRLGRLSENYRELARRAAPARVAPVVKADAYSVGMPAIARHLASAGADSFFVARLKEGVTLRKLLPAARIFVFDGLLAGNAAGFETHRLIPVLNTLDEISAWAAQALAAKQTLPAALQVDSGMNRSGLSRDDVLHLAGSRQALAGLDLQLIMSHLACADEPDHAQNRNQLERFRTALAMLPPAKASLAATSGIELGREYLFDVVRPGVGLYGGNPQPSRANPYRMVVRLHAPVLQLRQLQPGDCVGYGATFVAKRPSTIAIVAMGYADGIIRAAGSKGAAILRGRRVPFAGRISMDLLALDVTDLASEIQIGSDVEFLGDAISLEDMAAAAGTINHEVLTSITPRASRVYIGD